jgi:hypothetical protein
MAMQLKDIMMPITDAYDWPLAKLRAHKRQALLEATRLELDKICDRVARGALEGAAAIGVKLGRVLDKYKVGKHFELSVTDSAVKYQILKPQVAAEAALDGIYVIRTGLPKKRCQRPMPCAVTRRSPKSNGRSVP